ncbi:nephrin-like isoform X2 [Hypanus sabinus]|uniref:nephrin-like isoform X2 n=2 Tax=Hypanus sabinus TaxID=79690 RepID=UPI0028C4F12C|nr:nephrin-like isoform X2 [Hypanus sabinus]
MPAERADSGSSVRSFTLNPPGTPRPALQLRGMKAWLVSLLLVVGHRGTASRQMFRKEPENRTSIEGETSFLECEVEGASGPVQWVKDGLLLGPDRNLPGFPRYRMFGNQAAGVFDLQVDRVRLEDEGSYHCQVGRSDSGPGLISRTAWLQVLIPPRGPHFQELAVGDIPTWVAGEEYSLTCEAQDSKPVSNITIMKGDKVVTPAEISVKQGSNQKVFSTLSTISFIAKVSDNGKEMRCSAMNPALDDPRVTYFTMNVLFPPQKPKIKGYDGQPVRAGTTLELTCISGGGNPLATLHWLKGDTVLSMIWETGMKKGPARSVLSYPVTPGDNRVNLTCVASNQVTVEPLKTNVSLHVVYPPERVLLTGTPQATEGSEVSVSCQASASNPPARLQWWAIGMEFNVTEVTYPEGTGWSTTSNATFVAQRSVDGTSLVCEALNEALALATSTSVIISVFYPPERIWIQGPPKGAVFQTGTSVTLSCFASGGNPLANLSWAKGEEPVGSAVEQTLGRLAISRLTIVTQPSDNQAEYRCNAANQASEGALSARTWVGVQFAPLSLGIEAPATPIREGENFTLVCRAGESNPAVRISWVRNGERLRGDRSWMERGIFGGWICTSTLTFLASARHDGEQVRCQAFTPLLQEITNTFHTIHICRTSPSAPDSLPYHPGLSPSINRLWLLDHHP